jgi:hypothetical protein
MATLNISEWCCQDVLVFALNTIKHNINKSVLGGKNYQNTKLLYSLANKQPPPRNEILCPLPLRPINLPLLTLKTIDELIPAHITTEIHYFSCTQVDY